MIAKPTTRKKKKVKTPIPLSTKQCAECMVSNSLEIHHVFYGNKFYKDNSSLHSCVEWLCDNHHRGNNGVHGINEELNLRLKQKHQKRLMDNGMSMKEFIYLFGKNRL